MKILIVEDLRVKAAEIVSAVISGGAREDDISVVPDTQGAKEHLRGGHVTLLILDLQIPKRFDKDPSGSGGTDFVRWIMRREPRVEVQYVIALSAYDLTDDVDEQLAQYGVPFVRYQQGNHRWRKFVSAYAARAIHWSGSTTAVATVQMNERSPAVVLTTVDVELEAARRVFSCEATPRTYHGELWYHGSVGDTRVIVGQATQMGMPAAAVLTARALHAWAPEIVIMTGICAGMRGAVELGDLVVADPSWDYGSGKVTHQSILQPDPRPIPLGVRMKTIVRSLKNDRRLREWYDAWPGDKPRTTPSLHVDPAASGAAVVQSRDVTQGILAQARKAVALDMETYGVYFAASHLETDFVSIKAVVDFADPDKGDSFQRFGADLSCRFASLVIESWFLERGLDSGVRHR